MAREINLVPDIKEEMIRALKMRNLILFICIIVASASVAVSAIFASIAFGQQAVVDGNKETLKTLSNKINSYSELSEFLTIKDQLGNLSSISNNKKVLSRTFNLLSAIIPTGADTITISELNINLSSTNPTISFDAQANSGTPPDYIDYNVLDSFKKSMPYLRYDYGNYVDKNGNEIPAYCMIESGSDGATFYDKEKSSYYAFWLITGEGCNPSYEATLQEDVSETEDELDVDIKIDVDALTAGYTTETYNGQTVVRIWRTPQYDDWYKDEEVAGEPYMGLNGEISGVAHFASKCISYYGVKKESTGKVTWSSTNESCLLVPNGIDGIQISGSSNGIGGSGDLVLRFSATIELSPEIYRFSNKHVLALGPEGHFNVTDSYVQIQNIFEQRAADCAEGDTTCDNTNNEGGNQNG